MTRGLGLGLVALCLALGGCDGDDTKKNANSGGEGGGMGYAGGESGGSGGAPIAGAGGEAGAPAGGSAGAGGQPGSGGAAGTGGLAGTGGGGGEPVVPGAPGQALTAGGTRVSSTSYSAVFVTGESPGGNRVMSSSSYQLRLGLVGATQ